MLAQPNASVQEPITPGDSCRTRERWPIRTGIGRFGLRTYHENVSMFGEYEPSPATWVRGHVAKYESSGGTEGASMGPARVVILTTVGAKSGKLRKVPLIRVEHDGAYAVVASDSGSPKHPSWYFNLLAHSTARLQDGAEVRDMMAHETSGDERAKWWERALVSNPHYAEYQEKVSRVIPVLVLEELDRV